MPRATDPSEREHGVDGSGLAPLARALEQKAVAEHVIALSPAAGRHALVERTDTGAWRAGPYAGLLTVDGAPFALDPLIGWDELDGWVAAATGLPVPAAADDDAGGRVIALASMLWVRAVDGASRHGPPAFRRDVHHEGGHVRGHLDVRRTVRLRAKGSTSAASIYRARELDNPVTRIIVAADRALMRRLGHVRWRTERVDGVIAQLHTAVGRRSQAPGEGELHRMRYTPITRPFKWAAELSLRIVREDPLATTTLPGRPQGLLIELDDIFAAALLSWAREARPDLRAETVDAGQVVLRDRQFIRAMLRVAPGADGGAPVVAMSRFGAPSRRLELPWDAAAAAADVRAALELL